METEAWGAQHYLRAVSCVPSAPALRLSGGSGQGRSLRRAVRTADVGTGGTGHWGSGQASWRRWHLSRQEDLLVEGPSHTPLLTRHIPAVPALPPALAQGSRALWRRGALCSLVESCPWWPWPPGHPAGSTNPIQPPLASGTGTEPQAGGQRAWPPIPSQPQTRRFPLSPPRRWGSDGLHQCPHYSSGPGGPPGSWRWTWALPGRGSQPGWAHRRGPDSDSPV